MTRASQIIRLALIIAMMLPLAGAAGLIILHVRGERLLSVQSASMAPAFRRGDALFIRPVSASSLQPGNIVSYQSIKNPRVIISHRLVSIDEDKGEFITRGDALENPDPPVSPVQIIGKVDAVAPGLGNVVDKLRQPVILVALVYVPAIVFVANEVLRLYSHYRRPAYLLDYSYGAKS